MLLLEHSQTELDKQNRKFWVNTMKGNEIKYKIFYEFPSRKVFKKNTRWTDFNYLWRWQYCNTILFFIEIDPHHCWRILGSESEIPSQTE